MSTVAELTDLITNKASVAAVLVVVIAVVGLASFTDALGKLQAFITRVASEWTSPQQKKANPHAERFEQLKRQVIHVSIVNNLPVELHKLRAFFIEIGILTRPGFSEFYAEWLDQTFVEIGTPTVVPGFFSNERVALLKSQLGALRL